jgi:hypothetical protein
MVTMVLEVVYFPFHELLDFSGALGWAFQQLFQALYDSRFLPMTQIMQASSRPRWSLTKQPTFSPTTRSPK